MAGSAMKKTSRLLLCAALGAGISVAYGDATLVYDVSGNDPDGASKTLSVSRFFVRVASSDQPQGYLLFQAGKFFPLFRVDEQSQTYTRLTPPVRPRLGPADRGASEQKAPADAQPRKPPASGDKAPKEDAFTDVPAEAEASEADGKTPPSAGETGPAGLQLQPTKRMETVGGVRCRVVTELMDGEPAVEHCMANKAALGVTEREARTLARLFDMARKRGWDWLPAATNDEEFVSVRSRRAADGASWTLESVSTAALPAGYMRISREFRELPYQPPAEKQAATDSAGGAPAAPGGQNAAAPPPAAATGESEDIKAETPAN
jgi:hypothetical protein